MAKKREDIAAAKAKKQKIILAVGGVLLLAVAGIQGPKLLGGGSSAAPAPAATETTDVATPSGASTPATPTGSSVKVVSVSSGPQPTAVLAGVKIVSGGSSNLDPGQLVGFSLFEAKDPFVPQTSSELSSATEPTATPTPSDTQPGSVGKPGSTTSNAGAPSPSTTPKATPAKMTNATIVMDGKAYPVAVKGTFPEPDPLFVLVSVKSKSAKIGVAGGAFSDGKTISLVEGKQVTLVNDATGVRYVLKLVYTGTAPEQTETFTQATK